MTNPEDVQAHLRGASDAVLLITAEVRQLEEHKRGLQPGDARFEELATAIRRLTEGLAEFTREEETWAGQTTEPAADGLPSGSALRPIAETAAPPPLASILERWRGIERRLDEAEPGSAEAAELFEEFERVRREYLAAFEAREHRTGT